MTSRQAAENGGRLCGRGSQRRILTLNELVHLWEGVQCSSLMTRRFLSCERNFPAKREDRIKNCNTEAIHH